MLNMMVELALKFPDNNVTVKRYILLYVYWSDAFPVALNGELKFTWGVVRGHSFELWSVKRAIPDPYSWIITMPPMGMEVEGVSVTFMVTDVAAAIELLRVIEG